MATDSIRLSGLVFYGYHGVHAEERQLGQRFVVDVELGVELQKPGRSDDITDTINYSEVFQRVRDVVEGAPHNLLEAVAERIAQDLLAHTSADDARVRVTKPWAPVKGMT